MHPHTASVIVLAFSVVATMHGQNATWHEYHGPSFSMDYPATWTATPDQAEGVSAVQLKSDPSTWGGMLIMVGNQPDAASLDQLLESQIQVWTNVFAGQGGSVSYGSPEPAIDGALEGKSVTGQVALLGAPPVISIISVFHPHGISVAAEQTLLAKDQWAMSEVRRQVLSSFTVTTPQVIALAGPSRYIELPMQGDDISGDWYKNVSDGYNTTTTWLTLRADGTYEKLRQARFFPQGVVAFSQEGMSVLSTCVTKHTRDMVYSEARR